MLRLQDVFTDSKTVVFSVIDQEDDNELNWLIKPTKLNLIPEQNGFYIIRALEVSESDTKTCFIDMQIPERISEIVISQNKRGESKIQSIYDTEHTVIPSVASETYGDYDLFYAEENPEIGINILKKGLETAQNKSIVAEDLGYILRDEGRVEEAIDAFKISIDLSPANEYIYLELSDLYGELDDKESQEQFYQKFKENGGIDPE